MHNYIIIKSQNNKEPSQVISLARILSIFSLVYEKGRKKYFGESFINLNLFDSKDYPYIRDYVPLSFVFGVKISCLLQYDGDNKEFFFLMSSTC